jgi:hypothetical protein
MELTSLLIIIVALVYLAKNSKGKQFMDHCGNTMVNLSAAADDASAALHKQCHELLSDEAAAKAKAEAKAKIAKAKKVVAEDYDDAE